MHSLCPDVDSERFNSDNVALDDHLRRYKNPEKYRRKVLKIIEMSSKGNTIEQIENEVRMSRGNINSARRWGRLQGLI